MDYIIITGCNDSYILTLLDFIQNYKTNNFRFTSLVVYNYGLNENNLKKLLHYKSIFNFEIVDFDYSKYPEHLDLKKYNGLNCNYSFKVVSIYNECIKNPDKKLIWMDSANRFNLYTVSELLKIITQYGFYSPVSSKEGSIESLELHHIDCIKHFGLENDLHLLPQRAGGIIGIDYSNIIGKSIITEWYKCSLDKKIIAPEGSSRNNHRQDQSVLSMIMYLYEKQNNIKFFNNDLPGIRYWVKKDYTVVKNENKKFQIKNLQNNNNESIIFCSSKEEAINTYCSRKRITKNDLLKKYVINLVS